MYVDVLMPSLCKPSVWLSDLTKGRENLNFVCKMKTGLTCYRWFIPVLDTDLCDKAFQWPMTGKKKPD